MEKGREVIGSKQDGRFEVIQLENSVSLAVWPPQEGGAPVSVTDVYLSFVEKRFPWENAKAVEQAVQLATGEPTLIIGDLIAVGKDAEIIIKFSNDRMQAFGLVQPAEWGSPLTREKIKSILSRFGICYGIRQEVLEDILECQDEAKEWLIAEGKAPIKGTDAYLHYHVQVEKEAIKPAFLPDGRVDFRELDNVTNVKEGQLLAERIPPTPGQVGYNVLNEEIAPQPGKELTWRIGKGVELVNNQLLASLAGQVLIRNNNLIVSPVYEVDGDVDYSVGNIRFVGNVIVKGSVRPGFSIDADGDVKVFGLVDSANVTCTGSVIVSGGIQGQGRGEITADGNVYSRFIENCKVTAKGEIVIGEDIMHSVVQSGKSVQVGGRRGLIAGGIVRATDNVQCKVLGASLGTITCVEVGVNPAVFEEFGRLQGTVVKMEEELSRMSQGVRRLQQLQEILGSLPSDRKLLLDKLLVACQQYSNEIAEKRAQLSAQEIAIQAIRDAYVQATDLVFPGVRIVIGKSNYYVRDRLGSGRFCFDGTDVAFVAL